MHRSEPSVEALAVSPARLGPCRLGQSLGAGAFGSVHLAEMVEPRSYAPLGSEVAVKVFTRGLETRQLERFRREAEIGSRVDHVAVVKCFEIGQARVDGRRVDFLVMEYVPGGTLRGMMKRLGAVPENLLRVLAHQITSALGAVHRAGAIHRDLKPTNILITSDDRVKLSDLGVAALIEAGQHLTSTGAFVGTPSYAAPEQLLDGAVGPSTDLYALGIVLFEAATGQHPFGSGGVQAMVARHLMRPAPRLRSLQPRASRFLDETIACLLEKEPSARFASAHDFLRVLEAAERSPWFLARRDLEATESVAAPSRYARLVEVARDTPLVGREGEIAFLESQWHRCRDDATGQLILIEGEAGVGKSRLLDAFVGQIDGTATDLCCLYGGASPGVAVEPGALAAAAIRHLERERSPPQQQLARLLPDFPHLIDAFLARLQGLPLPAGSEPLEGEAVHSLLRRLAAALAEEQPVVWMVEDLHLATAETRSLLRSLAQVAAHLPMLILATHRPELDAAELSPLQGLPNCRRFVLERLGPSAVSEMMDRAFDPSVPASAVRHIARRADGNPLFLAEMLREVRHPAGPGIGVPNPDTPGLHSSLEIPGVLQDLLEARLASLDSEDRALLEIGAVEGYRFRPETVAKVRSKGLLRTLERLNAIEGRLGLIRSRGEGFCFDHHLLREVIYESLSPHLRQAYHREIARVLTTAEVAETPDTASGERAVQLCQHYLDAGDETGLRFARAALAHLAARFAAEDAVLLGNRALDLAAGVEHRELRCDLWLELADAFHLLGRRVEEIHAATRAFETAEGMGEGMRAARARLAQGRARIEEGAKGDAEVLISNAMVRADAADDRVTVARAVRHLGRLYQRGGRFAESLRCYERQLDLAGESGDERRIAEARFGIAMAYLGLDRADAARAFLEQSAELGERLGLVTLQTSAETSLASAWVHAGRFDRARELYARSLERSRHLGYVELEMTALVGAGMLGLYDGDLHRAEALYNRARQCAAILASPYFDAFVDLLGAEHASVLDDRSLAVELYTRALEGSRRLGAMHEQVTILHCFGRFHLLDRDRPEDARPLFLRAEELVEAHGLDSFRLVGQAAFAALGEGDPPAAEAPAKLHVVARIFAHLFSLRAGGDAAHGKAVERLLGQLAATFDESGRERFWRCSLLVRSARRRPSSGSRPVSLEKTVSNPMQRR